MLPESPSTSAPVSLRTITSQHAPPDTATPVLLGNAPRPLTSLIGRDAEVAAARALLVEGGVRLLTLTGPGGVGKTRLAQRIGEDMEAAFHDGVVFVPLATITDPALVVPAIARGLGLREAGTQSPTDAVADYLRGSRVLLVLDNFEQVRPAATQLAALLTACPGLVALVTSRALLRVAGEQRFPVTPLALPDEHRQTGAPGGSQGHPEGHGCKESLCQAIARSTAVQLFVARAQAVDPRFTLDAENAASIAAICRRLDGLPLAIELAAARIGVLSPGELLARLDPLLPLLSGGPADAPDRLRTMRHAIAWSYDLLSEEEQILFRRLAVFVGGFALESAERVAGWQGGRVAGSDTPSPLDLVASLVDTSLLRRTEEGGGEARFGMLETIREFGLERLAVSGETAAIAARHATWCVNLADWVRQTGQLSQGRGLGILEAEHPNLRLALTWFLAQGEATAALHLAGQLAVFWLFHGHVAEGQGWLERALAADDGAPTAARAEALVGLNMLLWARDEFARAERLLGEAETVAWTAGDAGALAYARLHQGYVALFRGDLDLAEERGEECLTTCEAIPQGFSCNGALWLLARAALARGDDERATELHERLLASARAEGDEISLANGLFGLATLAERRGEPGPALAGFAEAATVCQGFGDRFFAGQCLDEAAVTAVMHARLDPAVRLFAAADAMLTVAGGLPVLLFVVDRQRHEQALAAARAALGVEQFAAAWAAGAALSLNEAIAEATALACPVAAPDPSDPAAGTARLTGREREVLRLLVDGLSDKEIAAALGIGRRTVSNHVAAIRAKLDVPSRSAAVAAAVRDHLA